MFLNKIISLSNQYNNFQSSEISEDGFVLVIFDSGFEDYPLHVVIDGNDDCYICQGITGTQLDSDNFSLISEYKRHIRRS